MHAIPLSALRIDKNLHPEIERQVHAEPLSLVEQIHVLVGRELEGVIPPLELAALLKTDPDK
jgi:hypothetical protein